MKNNKKERLFEIMSKVNPDFTTTKPQLIIPVGISGSGKSTWIRTLENQGFIVVSPDDIRRELTGTINDQTKNNEVFELAYQRVIDALNSGKSVIFDATNLTSKYRIEMLDKFKTSVHRDFEALAKIFDSDPEISKQRIAKDIEAGVDRANVPSHAIDRQYSSFITDLDKLESDGFKIIQ